MVAVVASGSGGCSLVPAWGALCCVHCVGTANAGEGRALQARLGLHSLGIKTLGSRVLHTKE